MAEVNDNLASKSREELEEEIRRLRREIQQLNRILMDIAFKAGAAVKL